MNKIKIAKFATATVVGAGVDRIASGVIQNNVPVDDLTSFSKLAVSAARLVISAMAASKTKDYTDAQIDNIVANWNDSKTKSTETPKTA